VSDALFATMSAWLAPAEPAARARVASATSAQLADGLDALGFSRSAVAAVSRHFDAARADATFADLLARLVSAVEAARGRPEAPLAIWDDPHDAGDARRLLYLYLVALCAPGARAHLVTLGAPGDVVDATLHSFARHARLYEESWGVVGIDAGWWQLLALRGELVEIGRLQYHDVRLGRSSLSPHPWYDDAEAHRRGAGFCPGDAHVGLHIPAGPGFSAAALDASLERAREVLGAIWPSSQRRLASCASWLLDDQLDAHLDASSHILAFARRFTMVPGALEDDADILHFVFRRPRAGLDELPQRTRLERAIVAHLRAGGHWRTRTGWIDFDGPR
jgi:hypothetical protein